MQAVNTHLRAQRPHVLPYTTRHQICVVAAAKAAGRGPERVQPQLIQRRHVLTALTLTAACPCCQAEASDAAISYDTAARPSAWGGTCSTGSQQSPINLSSEWFRDSVSVSGGRCSSSPLNIMYPEECAATIKNTGSGTMQVNVAPGGMLLLRGVPYTLLQYHFHAPAEHAVDGTRAAMEAHLVHRSDAGDLAVLGVQLQPTAEEDIPGLAVALQHAPAEAGQTVPCPVPVCPSSLLPAAALSAAPSGAMKGSGAAGVLSRYVHYSGSLTTPPCSEGVDWIVLGDSLPVTPQQVAAFQAFVLNSQAGGSNARPLQQLNGRVPRANCLDL